MIPFALVLGIVLGMGRTEAPVKKPVIALAAAGDAPSSIVDALVPILRETFDADVVEAPAGRIPASAWNASREQYHSTKLLDALAAARRPEWERLLGIVDVDLYVPELNFVFGEGDSRRGVAVFSLARLRAAGDSGVDDALFARRAATEAVHELGHTYGLSHCDEPTCVMWFSNTLAETDRKGHGFCPEHERELKAARRH